MPFSTSSLGRIAVEPPKVVAGVDAIGDRHLQREVVDLLETGNLLGRALLDVDRALDQADVAGAGIALAAIHDAGEGEDHVVGRHLAAVMERTRRRAACEFEIEFGITASDSAIMIQGVSNRLQPYIRFVKI